MVAWIPPWQPAPWPDLGRLPGCHPGRVLARVHTRGRAGARSLQDVAAWQSGQVRALLILAACPWWQPALNTTM
jgi:hypothetical protein